jgi:hypothetical protein
MKADYGSHKRKGGQKWRLMVLLSVGRRRRNWSCNENERGRETMREQEMPQLNHTSIQMSCYRIYTSIQQRHLLSLRRRASDAGGAACSERLVWRGMLM